MEGYIHRIERSVSFTGPLTDEQRTRLREIAHKCPVHKTLTSQIVIGDAEGDDETTGTNESGTLAASEPEPGNFF